MKRTGRNQVSKYSLIVAVPLVLAAVGSAGCSTITSLSAPMQTAHAMAEPPHVQVEPATTTTEQQTAPVQATPAPQEQTPKVAPLAASKITDDRPDPAAAKPATPPVPPANPSQVVYYNGSKKAKLVALTFDDGPDNKFTPKILDVLKQNDVKATFFVIGSHAKTYPDVVKRIVDEGNVIGNHSWDHGQLSKMNRAQVKSEIDRTDAELYAILGFHPALFRPPYGETTKNAVQECTDQGYNLIDWSVDSRDWAGTPTPQIMSLVHSEMYPGGIILQHSAGGKNGDLSNTVAATQQIITSLKAQGYQFVTIPQLLGVPAIRTK